MRDRYYFTDQADFLQVEKILGKLQAPESTVTSSKKCLKMSGLYFHKSRKLHQSEYVWVNKVLIFSICYPRLCSQLRERDSGCMALHLLTPSYFPFTTVSDLYNFLQATEDGWSSREARPLRQAVSRTMLLK